MFIFERPFSWWYKQNYYLYKNGEFKDNSILTFYDQEAIFDDKSITRSQYCEFLSINNLLDILKDFSIRCSKIITKKSDYWNSIYINTILQTGSFRELAELYETIDDDLKLDYRQRVNKTYLNGRLDVNFSNEKIIFETFSSIIPVKVVNLPSDFYRKDRLDGLFRFNGIEASFVKAYTPSAVASAKKDIFKFLLPDDLSVLDGTFGNQYTVYKIMKEISESKYEDWNLVVEDDVLMVSSVTHNLISNFPADAELIFLNDRLCKFNKLLSLEDHLKIWQDDPKVDSTAPGSDAYIVKKSAATKIVKYFETFGITSVGTDWAILSCCLTNKSASELGVDRVIYKNFKNFFNSNDNNNHINAYVNGFPVFVHSPFNSYRAWR